jgi:hypothetical protein
MKRTQTEQLSARRLTGWFMLCAAIRPQTTNPGMLDAAGVLDGGCFVAAGGGVFS